MVMGCFFPKICNLCGKQDARIYSIPEMGFLCSKESYISTSASGSVHLNLLSDRTQSDFSRLQTCRMGGSIVVGKVPYFYTDQDNNTRQAVIALLKMQGDNNM